MSERSRSPRSRRQHRQRSRSPLHHHRHSAPSKKHEPAPTPPILPFKAQPLRKSDLETYRPLFELYLDIQKHKILEDLPDEEVRGRWKSFTGKWNRAELAEGWYDPATLQRAQESLAATEERPEPPARPSRPTPPPREHETKDRDESDDDNFGPALPLELQRYPDAGSGNRSGPAIPNMQDLELRREQVQEDREHQLDDLRHQRKTDRQLQKSRLDELAPRAEAGTRERQLEKKREKADSNRSFAASKAGGDGMPDVPDSDLMGEDGGGGIEGYKRQKMEVQRKKNEREIRKEEIWRARAEEREDRIRVYKEKEADTMSGLVALAKARFG